MLSPVGDVGDRLPTSSTPLKFLILAVIAAVHGRREPSFPENLMLNLSLIPVIGVLLLVALSIFVTNRRAHRVAEVRADVDRRRQQIIRDDGRNDELFVDNLLAGLGMDRSIACFINERAKLLPGVNPEAPAAWTIDILEQSIRDDLRRDIERVNRGLFAPALVVATLIVGVCCVTAALLYQFHSGPSPDPGDSSNELIVVP